MKVIVGLGNPGGQYENVRHNLGFMVLDEFALGLKGEQWKLEKKLRSGIIKSNNFLLLKPQTFMNNSGQAVFAAVKYFKVKPEDVILVHDELDLPLGKIRLKLGGGAAGHHGVESVIEALKTDKFQRVRLGIGPAVGAPEKFVLDQFKLSEEPEVKRMIKEAAKNIVSLIE